MDIFPEILESFNDGILEIKDHIYRNHNDFEIFIQDHAEDSLQEWVNSLPITQRIEAIDWINIHHIDQYGI